MSKYYILNYADYETLPTTLFCGNTSGLERKNIDLTKFVAHCENSDCTCLDYIIGNPTEYNDTTIHTALSGAEWNY
jgi:hypothetical protein